MKHGNIWNGDRWTNGPGYNTPYYYNTIQILGRKTTINTGLCHPLCFRHRLRLSSSFTIQNSSSVQKNSKMKSTIVLLAAAASVSAHSTWQDLWVGTTDQATTCTRTVIDNNPIASLTSADMFCGRSPKATTGVCTVAGMRLITCQS